MNLPHAVIPLALTRKDRDDLQSGLDLGIDWVARSFVQKPADVAEAPKIVAGRAGVLSKIEKPAALAGLNGIIASSDAVMIAPGDLGVEVPPQTGPIMQRRIIKTCREVGRPVIVATHMLEPQW